MSDTLRVGVTSTVSPDLLTEVTPTLRKSYPRLTVLWLVAPPAERFPRSQEDTGFRSSGP